MKTQTVSSSTATLQSYSFNYDNWNLIQYSGGNTPAYLSTGFGRYAWLGKQLVAAQLQTSPPTWNTYIPAYDGNGNVRKLIDANT